MTTIHLSSSTIPSIVLLAAALVGCATPDPPVTRRFTDAQIHELVRRNNEHAEPYELGTGDGTGASVYQRYLQKSDKPN